MRPVSCGTRFDSPYSTTDIPAKLCAVTCNWHSISSGWELLGCITAMQDHCCESCFIKRSTVTVSQPWHSFHSPALLLLCVGVGMRIDPHVSVELVSKLRHYHLEQVELLEHIQHKAAEVIVMSRGGLIRDSVSRGWWAIICRSCWIQTGEGNTHLISTGIKG